MAEDELNFEYQVGGSLCPKAPSYITREADLKLYQALKLGIFCYIFNSRQMGKSSLRVRTMAKLKSEGYICLYIDLTGIGSHNITQEQWYTGVIQSIVSSYDHPSEIQWRAWWKERKGFFSPAQQFVLFITEILLVEIKQNIIIFIDEVDHILTQKFPLDEFFIEICYIFEQRNTNPNYRRLTFALFGVSTPNHLIKDKFQRPFDIGQFIELEGFKYNEIQPLLKGLQKKFFQPNLVINEILNWTSGQPFLTQKLCKLVIDSPFSSINSSPAELVKKVIMTSLVDNWESNDEPEHLRTIQDRILHNQQRVSSLLGIYQEILIHGWVEYDNSPEHLDLCLSGLVTRRLNILKVYNRIYEIIFDLNWVEKSLATIRPYSQQIYDWLASDCQNNALLLRNEELQNALAFSLGKSLSNSDYQYLLSSLDLGKREVQTTLELTEQASQILAAVKKESQKEVQRKKIKLSFLPLIVIVSIIFIGLLKFFGLLELIELNLYDQYYKWHPFEAPDPTIVVVKIDDLDLEKINNGVISDLLLARAISNIKDHSPRVIGLDMLRNLPIEPGHLELEKVFQSTPNLIGIEKLSGEAIRANLTLKNKLNRVGFADIMIDKDKTVRRAILLIEDNLSFPLRLAIKYTGIEPEDLGNEKIRIGKSVFKSFRKDDGIYINADDGGYQILMNYRKIKSFTTISFSDLLIGNFPGEIFKDRLVLIGSSSQTTKDFFSTPINGQLNPFPKYIPGVYLHANIASQIIASALTGRKQMHTLDKIPEFFWIIFLSFVFTLWVWSLNSLISKYIVIIFAILFSIIVGYLLFSNSIWFPIVQLIMTTILSSILLLIFTNRRRDKILFKISIDKLLELQKEYPKAALIALEYFKQSETKKHQMFIDQIIKNFD